MLSPVLTGIIIIVAPIFAALYLVFFGPYHQKRWNEGVGNYWFDDTLGEFGDSASGIAVFSFIVVMLSIIWEFVFFIVAVFGFFYCIAKWGMKIRDKVEINYKG